MNTTIIIHTENENKLRFLLNNLEEKIEKSKFSIYLHAKNYIPWNLSDLKTKITSFREFNAYPTQKDTCSSVVEILLKCKDGDVVILDENNPDFTLTKNEFNQNSSVYCNKKDLLSLNLDTKYENLKFFITDICFQKNESMSFLFDETSDSKRLLEKKDSSLFREKIIYIDGGMGDHIMALPLLERISSEVYVCCKYPVVFEHLPIKGYIHWLDNLFGGYDRFVYHYGSVNEGKTIIDSFFEIYGFRRESNDVLKYTGSLSENQDVITDKKIALICTSAAKIGGLDSNKDWRDVRWLKLVHELKKKGYFVIQVGTKNDNQIPNVDFKFLDRSINNLAKLISDSKLWITVDTFFHHFAASINPSVGICLTPFYNDHAKHNGVTYIEKNCGKDFSSRKWWLDSQQPERKECMDLIQLEDVLKYC